jgi:Leucine-rich repeat (LRR) protein
MNAYLLTLARCLSTVVSFTRLKAFAAFILAFACVSAPSLYAQVPAGERAVLIALYNSAGGASWTNRANWRNVGNTDFNAVGTECTWYGVYCNATATNVEQLYLPNNNLVGTLPALNSLPSLNYINVERNQLEGSLPSLSGLTGFLYLVANDNRFIGTIPSLSGLSALQEIRVHNNQLSGPIPSLTGLSSLKLATFHGNQLTGSLPALGGLSSLSFLNVGDNLLTGSIPAFPSLPALTVYVARNNRLTGTIPTINSLAAIKSFQVDRNQLTGSMPALNGLTSLQVFDVNDNQLTGSIPALSGLTSMQYFYVFDNRLSGLIPSLAGLNALEFLEVGGNRLTGLPPAASSGLRADGSGLCPNQLARVANTAWDTATGATPWYVDCECRLDVNGDGPYTADVDGVILNRYFAGVRGPALIAGFTLSGDRTTASAIEAYIAAQDYDVRGLSPANPKLTRDGLVITRFLRDLAAVEMISSTGVAATDADAVRARVAGWCGLK